MTNVHNKTAGFTLIELMIGMLVGFFIMAAVTSMTINAFKSRKDIEASAKLNQELGTVMAVMSNEIRRAGYNQCFDNPITPLVNECCTDPTLLSCPSDKVIKQVNYKVSGINGEDLYIDGSFLCVLYSYNRNANGQKDDNERNGFKFDNGQVKIRTSCTNGSDTSFDAPFNGCANDCSQGTWVPLTDTTSNDAFIIVDTDVDGDGVLETFFSTDRSKCSYVLKAKYWITQDNSKSTKFPCLEEDSSVLLCEDVNNNGVIEYPIPPATTTTDCVVTNVPSLVTDDKVTEVRQVNITIEGELGHDDSIRKTLTTSVRVGNRRVVKIP